MNTSKNPFEEMMRAAQDMAQAMNPALETFSPKGFEAMMPKSQPAFSSFSNASRNTASNPDQLASSPAVPRRARVLACVTDSIVIGGIGRGEPWPRLAKCLLAPSAIAR